MYTRALLFSLRGFHHCRWQPSRMFFLHCRRPFVSHRRVYVCFFLCLLGNLAVVTRRLDPLLRKREGYQWWRRVHRGWEGRVREDTDQERDLDAIFKSGATSILSPLSADSFSPSTLLNRASLQGRKKRTVGYSNTTLNRYCSLTLTRDHPLVRWGGLPHASRTISWISFRCFDAWGILVKTSSLRLAWTMGISGCA